MAENNDEVKKVKRSRRRLYEQPANDAEPKKETENDEVKNEEPQPDDGKNSLENRLKKQTDRLITDYMQWSKGMKFVPVPFANILGITNLQTKMIRDLARIYGCEYTDMLARLHVVAVVGGIGDRQIEKMPLKKVLRMIPGIKILAGTLSLPSFAAASTYAVGHVFQEHFKGGGTLLNFRAHDAAVAYDTYLNKGKQIAETIELP